MAARILVIGGNGFVGSAVCRSAVARGWGVTSLSRSGKPFVTREGYCPAWTKEVDWRAGDSFDPRTYSALLPSTTAVVSTLGILMEGEYKNNGKVSPLGVLRGVVETAMGGRGNPLRKSAKEGTSYERMNRDAALAVFDAFAGSKPDSLNSPETTPRSPFIYLSAEDIFRPFVSARYIETKREAEQAISHRSQSPNTTDVRSIRPVFVRPSLIYHPHLNPLSTLPATILNASSSLQSLLPPALRASHLSTPSKDPTSIPPPFTSFASLLTIPPIHVDTIAEAICRAVEDETIEGILGVAKMRAMQGFNDLYDREAASNESETNMQ